MHAFETDNNTTTVLRPYQPELDIESYEPSEHDRRYGYYDVVLPDEGEQNSGPSIPRLVPPTIPRPPYIGALSGAFDSTGMSSRKRCLITDPEDVRKLRRAAQLAAKTLQFAGSLVQAEVTTDEIDRQVHEFIVAHGAYPSPLQYMNFPKSCCTSVNNIITHGIPDNRHLQDGDIVNVDITVYLHGFHGDTSRTFLVGDVDAKGRELVQVTETALDAAIAVCAPGRPFRDIAQAIHAVLRGRDYCVSPQFTGHGIGREFHRQPWIFHTVNDEPEVMAPGDCFTIEPAIIQGDDTSSWTWLDDWTVSTENAARSAQAEHMIYITDKGVEVLTRMEN